MLKLSKIGTLPVKNYFSLIAPEKAGIVKLYTGKVPIFDNFSITKQIKAGFGRVVNYKHGAYLIIEHTEALHVVDVNSGNRTREKGQEANALDVNLGAADELARQLRLRDMGGIIVVDFIDMNLAEDRQLLYERMCKNMKRYWCQAQHPAIEQVRTDADYTPACTSGYGCECR